MEMPKRYSPLSAKPSSNVSTRIPFTAYAGVRLLVVGALCVLTRTLVCTSSALRLNTLLPLKPT